MFKSILSGYQAIIFDMDGTILENQQVWDNAIRKVLGKYVRNENPYWGERGLPLLELIEDIRDGNEGTINFSVEKVYNEINQDFFDHFMEVEIKPGFEELAEKLIADEKRLVLVTNTDREIAFEILSKLDLLKYFEFILTRNDVEVGKPEPDIYLLAHKKLGVIKERILVFEDSPSGFLACERAALNSVIVLPENAYAGEYGSNAKVFIKNFYDVLELYDVDLEDFYAQSISN